MKRFLKLALITSSLQLNPSWADDSSRSFYILADTPVSYLDLGLYRLDLAQEKELKPEIARLLNTRDEGVQIRNFITVGQNTDMILVLETSLNAVADRQRTKEQAERICKLLLDAQERFMRTRPIIEYFKSKDPFLDKFPAELAANLERTIRLVARVPTGSVLPTTQCSRPLVKAQTTP